MKFGPSLPELQSFGREMSAGIVAGQDRQILFDFIFTSAYLCRCIVVL